MKRIKIMLTVITVFAIVGGALAFKATKFISQCVYTTAAWDMGKCNNAIANSTTTTVKPMPLALSYYATTRLKDAFGNCPAIGQVSDCQTLYYTKFE